MHWRNGNNQTFRLLDFGLFLLDLKWHFNPTVKGGNRKSVVLSLKSNAQWVSKHTRSLWSHNANLGHIYLEIGKNPTLLVKWVMSCLKSVMEIARDASAWVNSGSKPILYSRKTEKNSSSIKDSKVSEMMVLTTASFPLLLRLMKKMYESWRTAVDNCKAKEVVILTSAAVLDIIFLFK